MEGNFMTTFWLALGYLLTLIDSRLQDGLGVLLAFFGF